MPNAGLPAYVPQIPQDLVHDAANADGKLAITGPFEVPFVIDTTIMPATGAAYGEDWTDFIFPAWPAWSIVGHHAPDQDPGAVMWGVRTSTPDPPYNVRVVVSVMYLGGVALSFTGTYHFWIIGQRP